MQRKIIAIIFYLLLLHVSVNGHCLACCDVAREPAKKDIWHPISVDFLNAEGTLGGWVQLDKNWFTDSPIPHKQHLVRRLRLYATTTTDDILTLMFMVQGDKDTWGYHYIYPGQRMFPV